MDLRRLAYFIAVAEELNFTRAAARLQISQPPLSQQIAKLEHEIGVLLLERNSRHVRLTPAGRVLLEEARNLLRRVDESTRIVRGAASQKVSPVRIGSVSSAFSGVLLRTLREVHRLYPDVLPLVYEMGATTQREALAHHTIDIGFMRSSDDSPDVSVTPVATEQYMAALPSESPLSTRGKLRLTELRREPFVLFPRASSPDAFDRIIVACKTAGFSPDIAYEVDNDHTLIALVAAQLAVSVVPEGTTNLSLPGVHYVPLEAQLPNSIVSVAMNNRQSHPIASLVAHIATEIHRTNSTLSR